MTMPDISPSPGPIQDLRYTTDGQLEFRAEQLTLPQLITARSGFGQRLWVRAPGGELRYGDAPRQASRWAALLAQQGIGLGDRVAVMSGNRHEFVSLVLGCGWLGAVIVPINTASRGMQLRHILGNSGARLLVADAAACSMIAGLDVETLPLSKILLLDPLPRGLELPVSAQALPALPEQGLAPAEACPGDTLAILYTSGTSGPSKGVCCPHAQFYWWGVLVGRQLQVTEEDILYTALPLFHINALSSCFQALVAGASVHYDAKFSVSRYFDRLRETEATVTYLLGAMVPMLMSRARGPEESNHRTRVAMGGGVPPRYHPEFIERTGILLLEAYASTETNLAIGGTYAEQRLGTMGRLQPDFEACVASSDDQPVPDGEPGELLLRPRTPFSIGTGYFQMPEKTVEAWRNLWFHTGDRVVREADGYFRFLDRAKDAIRRRGENISSYEVEHVLQEHPAVAISAVYAIRSELAEDEIMAALTLKPDAQVSPEELLDFCVPRMPYYSVPRYLRFIDELPRTENGKIRKFVLREQGITPDTWDRETAGYHLIR